MGGRRAGLRRLPQCRSPYDPAHPFDPVVAGDLDLANRIVMAPLTRNRAGPGLVPSEFAAEYYSQRATAGLIVAEATQVSAQAQGYSDTPGCYTDEQVAGWEVDTDAVYAKGGVIVVQLWHCGRISHTVFQHGEPPVGPSAIRAEAKTFVKGEGFVDVSTPRARCGSTGCPASSPTPATPRAVRSLPDSAGSNSTARTAICSTPYCVTARTTGRTLMVGRSPIVHAC